MKPQFFFATCALVSPAVAKVFDRPPLSYAPIPKGIYRAPNEPDETTLLDFIESREDLSELAKVVKETPGESHYLCISSPRKKEQILTQHAQGFIEAFSTSATWQYTFFAPSNEAFNNTGRYYNTFAPTPKGMWWTGQMLQHHYIPNSRLYKANFTTEKTRIQLGSYLWASAQIKDDSLVLNNVAKVVEGDIAVTKVGLNLDRDEITSF